MKTIIKSALISGLILSGSLFQSIFGQITITQSDMPSQGDTVRTSTGLNIEFIDVEDTGPDFTWDFSQLISVSQSVDSFVSVLETPIFYWPFFILSANLASPLLSDLPIPNLPLTDVYSFYNNTSGSYQDVGFAATLSGIPLPFKYENPDILYDFPMNYGNADSSESGYQFGIEDVGYILMYRKRVNYVDGWGTLITPYGTFQVLRQRSEVTEYDSIYIDSLNFGLPVNRNFIEYKWLGKGYDIPLLQITSELGGMIAVYQDSLQGEIVSALEIIDNTGKMSVFPNPFSNTFHLNLEINEVGSIWISMYDMAGRQVMNEQRTVTNPGEQQFQFYINKQVIEPGNFLLIARTGKKIMHSLLTFKP